MSETRAPDGHTNNIIDMLQFICAPICFIIILFI